MNAPRITHPLAGLPLGSMEERDERDEAATRTRPVAAECVTCGHTWAVCYLPMPLERAARLMQGVPQGLLGNAGPNAPAGPEGGEA